MFHLRPGRAAESYDRLANAGAPLEELGSKFAAQSVGTRFFREFGEHLVDELCVNPPVDTWTPTHADAWRQVYGDILGYIAHGVATGRPTVSAGTLMKSAEIVKARPHKPRRGPTAVPRCALLCPRGTFPVLLLLLSLLLSLRHCGHRPPRFALPHCLPARPWPPPGLRLPATG